jgi:hypothetical protein
MTSRRPPPLTNKQREQLSSLEPALKACVRTADIVAARKIAAQIQILLRATGHETRLLQAKNWLYECAMEAGEIQFAIAGFSGTRQLASPRTRLYFEATVLLGICYLRRRNLLEAEVIIGEAFRKINNITSDRRRRQFHERLVTRLEEESILAGIASSEGTRLNIEEIDREAVKLVRTKSDDELLEILARQLPDKSILLLETVRNFSEKRLPAPDRKFLPKAVTREHPIALGMRATAALKRVAWKSVCDPQSEIYQAWSQGLSVVYDKKYLTAAIVASFAAWQITTTMIVATVVAIIIKFGAAVFCETFAPQSIMIDRRDG